MTKGADANVANEKGETPLMGFMQQVEPNPAIAATFLDRGANVNLKAKDGKTALIALASNSNIHKPSVDTMSTLIQRGADVNARDNSGKTALMRAAEKGYMEMTRLLLDKNVEADATDNEGKTALMLALERGHFDVAEILVNRGADVNTKDKTGKGPLKQTNEVTEKFREFLLQHGARE